MELAVSRGLKTYVSGLAKCIERDAQLSWAEKTAWKANKQEGSRLFDPAQGGIYEVFDQRPLSEKMLKYCVQDVVHMPGLYGVYSRGLSAAW